MQMRFETISGEDKFFEEEGLAVLLIHVNEGNIDIAEIISESLVFVVSKTIVRFHPAFFYLFRDRLEGSLFAPPAIDTVNVQRGEVCKQGG